MVEGVEESIGGGIVDIDDTIEDKYEYAIVSGMQCHILNIVTLRDGVYD